MNSLAVTSRAGRVLVVDDEDSVRAVVAAMLRRDGFEVCEAHDGLEALAMARATPPDVIVSDLNMPRCDGEQLCAELRKDFTTASIPVVLITGGVPDEARLRGLGCVAFLHKPLSLSITDDVRRALIGSQRVARAMPMVRR